MDGYMHGIFNDGGHSHIGPPTPEARSDDHHDGGVGENHPHGYFNVAVSEAEDADRSDLVLDLVRILDASELNLERISLDSTINGVSSIDQHSVQRSAHSATTEPRATQAPGVAQAEESQPLSGKPPSHAEGSLASSSNNTKRSYWKTWWLEVMSSFLALSCLIAMITILAIHQGQPLPNWPKLISINSLISIFTAVFKASLIMPIAEGLGAFVAILALAVDPFSQAMIQHRPCDRELDSSIPQVARTNIYEGSFGRFHVYDSEAALNEGMVGAIYQGLVDLQETSALIDFKCATGNCTFGQRNGQRNDASMFSHYLAPAILLNVFGNAVRAFGVHCSLHPCVKTYYAEVTNGTYTETEYNAPGERLRKCSVNYDYDRKQTGFALVTNSTIIDGKEHPCEESRHEGPETVKFYEEGGLWGPATSPTRVQPKYYPRERVWAVDMTSWLGITAVLQSTLAGSLVHTGALEQRLDAVTGPFWLRRIFARGQGNLSTADDVVRGVAHSMTASIRNMPFGSRPEGWDDVPAYLKHASGKALTTDTCINVAWGWLAYLLSLLLLQWIFSALVLLKGWKVGKAGEERMVWKSSPIPLLFHGLDEDLREKNGDLVSLREMDGVSGKLKVQLAPAGGQKRKGWRLCES
ncbi:hypothetical protein CSOJ01_15628 [Colletotrichum sojae]|uniref:Uncharacterized protein n=1 Tax=Colletotrichum sojae TaxID=2175907 RepID=A0A8H6MHC4_9PEZI|nr:hypothetical protein CSOJ01_15628 [Colletotrichum sojae]